MAITLRTTTQAGTTNKGDTLTHAELDANFVDLLTNKLADLSDDTSPQLGGNLDVNGNQIVSTSNANVKIYPNGTGVLEVGGDGSSADGTIQLNCSQNSHGVKIKSPPHSAGASYTLTLPTTDGNSGEFLKTDGSGGLSWGTSTGMSNLSDDSSPQLGGNLDLQNNKIVSTSAQNIKLEPDGAGDIYLESDTVFAGENNAQAHLTSQGTGNLLLTTNNDSNSGKIKINQGASGNIEIQPDGGGRIRFHNAYNMPSADGTNGQVMTTDGAGNISFTTASGGGSIELEAGTGINITQPDSTGAFTITNNASVSDLSDTSISSVSDGQVLAYASGNWTNQAIDISSKSINDLSDVNTAGVSDGQVLTYSNANSRFEPQTASGGGGVSYALALMNFSVASGGSYTSATSFVAQTLGDTPSEQTDDDGILTLGTNGSNTTHFTLSAGKYEIRTYVTGYYETGDSVSPGDWQFELYNASDSTSVMLKKFNDDYDNIFSGTYGRWPFQFVMPAYVNISGSKNFIYRIAASLTGSREINIRADGGRSNYYNQTKDGGVVVTILKVG